MEGNNTLGPWTTPLGLWTHLGIPEGVRLQGFLGVVPDTLGSGGKGHPDKPGPGRISVPDFWSTGTQGG